MAVARGDLRNGAMASMSFPQRHTLRPNAVQHAQPDNQKPEQRSVDLIQDAEEFSLAINRAHDLADVEVIASKSDLQRLKAVTAESWIKMGQTEPYWSVLTNPAYKGLMSLDSDAERDFFSSGQHEMEVLARILKRNEIDASGVRIAAEFGCGVGRIAIHMARQFPHYLGIDFSAPHLAIAADKCRAQGLTNTSFILLDDLLDGDRKFDLLYSLLVLQHNPPPLMFDLLKTLLSRLNPGGIALFQIPCVMWNYRFRIMEYLDHGPRGMEMHALPQRYVFRALAESGCDPIETVLAGRIGTVGLSYLFLVRRRAESARRPGLRGWLGRRK
jgi:SAM-dependent methyltransferase